MFDKDILSPCVNGTSKKNHQQCILKPFFLVFFCHSVHFLARRTEMVNSSSRTVGKALVPGPHLARTLCAYVELCKMNDTNTYLKTTTHHCAWYIGRETHWGPLSKLTSQKHLDAFFPLVQCGICGCPSESDGRPCRQPSEGSSPLTWTPWESSCGRPLTSAGTAASSSFSGPSDTAGSS